MQGSYIIIHFVTNGGIGTGLAYDAPFLNNEDKKLLLLARSLALNFQVGRKCQDYAAFRLNARWIDYTSEDAETGANAKKWGGFDTRCLILLMVPAETYARTEINRGRHWLNGECSG